MLYTASILANMVSPDQTPSQNFRVTQRLRQADEPVINDFGFLPTCPTTPVSVNESYLSMVNSPMKTEQTKSGCQQCSHVLETLENRLAELETEIVQRETAAANQESTDVTEKIVSGAIQFETRLPKVIAKAMRAQCSFKGGITTKRLPRIGLLVAERDAIIDVISINFLVDKPVVEQKMRSALHRF